jgi:hypothetical protein
MKTGNRRRRILQRKQKARALRARCERWQREDRHNERLRELNAFKNSQAPMREPDFRKAA